MLADPYRISDCCLETDGAAALIVTSVERARDTDKTPVYIMGRQRGNPTRRMKSPRKDFHKTGLSIAAPEGIFRWRGSPRYGLRPDL